MESPTPPTPRSMSDDELNAEVARLQSQPDGLMAAMALIEAQNLLRQQDSFAFSQWQLQAQMQAASAPRVVQEPAPVVAEPMVPEPDSSTPSALPAPEMVAPELTVPPEPVSVVKKTNSVEDVVAALNLNYAKASSQEIQTSNPEVTEDSVSEPHITAGTGDQQVEHEPAPLTSVVSVIPPTENETDSEEVVNAETSIAPVARTRTAAALIWSWLSLASTPLILVLAAFLRESGASFAQSLLIVSGLIVSTSLLAGFGAVAAKRGSSPIAVVSRAAFGVWGNVIPAVFMLVVKLSWAIALVVFGARALSPLISNQPWFSSLSSQLIFPDEFNATMFTAVSIVLIASLVAGFGGIIMLRSQQITSVFCVIGLGGIAYYVFSSNTISSLQQGEMLQGSSLLDLAILGFALFGFTVFSQSGDFARKLAVDTPGAKVFFISFVSTLIFPLVLGVIGVVWMFMSDKSFVLLLTNQFIPTIAATTPIWVFIGFVVAVGLSVLQLLANSLYSLVGSGSAIGIKIPGAVAVLLFSILVLAVTLVSSLLIATSSLLSLIIELLTLVSVVAAAYTGIVLTDSLLRSRAYHEVSLTRDYGFYGRFNVANSIGFVLAIAVGFGYLNGTGIASFWAGYLGDFTPTIYEFAGANIGIAMAFGLALLFPVIFGIPKIKDQERKLVELDERREELKEYLDTAK